MYGRPDAIVNYNGGEKFVLEFKERTGYVYKKYLHRYASVSAVEPSVYSQLQTYIDTAGLNKALLIVSPADFAMLQNSMRKNKAWGENYNLPPFHLEWVERNNSHIDYLAERANTIKEMIKLETPPRREYSGIPIGLNGKKTFPCGYCVYNFTCTKEYGFGNRT